MAIENCEHIVYLQCSPRVPISPAACSAYLSAAINTEHTMMFTFSMVKVPMEVISVKNAQNRLKKNAYKFMRNFGDQWLFCKCKKENVRKCHGMSQVATNDFNVRLFFSNNKKRYYVGIITQGWITITNILVKIFGVNAKNRTLIFLQH